MIAITPSILTADFAHLAEEIAKIAGADWLHLDVMDGHFVPNLTVGPMVAKALIGCSSLMVEAHLMVCEPEKMIPWFADAGCGLITIHAEATVHLHRAVGMIKDRGLQAGVALNPATPPQVLDYLLEEVDLVLVMTVNPGFGAQQFIPATLAKIAAVRRMLAERNPACRLQVDGGINRETLGRVLEAGADTLVVGNAIYSAPDPGAAVAELRNLANSRV